MSHMLRMWSELKLQLAKEIPSLSGSIAFQVASPTKHVRRLLTGNEFVLSYLPGGATTFAADGVVTQLPESWSRSPGTQSVLAKFNEDHSIEVASFCVVNKVLDSGQRKHLRSSDLKRVGYQQWLDSEAVRVGMSSESGLIEVISIPRDVLIRRVANKYQGSHSRLVKDPWEGESKFDSCVAHLMQFRLGGLPLPYFILLKAANDILSIVGPKIAGHI